MLRNYLTIAIRSMRRNWMATVISTAGLAIAFAVAILVASQSLWERSFNTQFVDTSDVYRIIRSSKQNDGEIRYDVHTSGALSNVLQESYPDVVSVTRLFRRMMFVGTGGQGSRGLGCLADDNVFDRFDWEFVKGDRTSFLKESSAILVTERFAEKLFGREDPMGRDVEIAYRGLPGIFRVAAVVRIPPNMSIAFDVLSTESMAPKKASSWTSWRPSGSRFIETYVKLRSGADPERFESDIQAILGEHMGPETASTNAYHLQPIDRIYLHSKGDYGIIRPRSLSNDPYRYGDASLLHNAAVVSILILVIAMANFVNLSTAQAVLRTREVGVRKVSGAQRSRLIGQFLTESVVLSVAALFIAVGLILLGQSQLQFLTQTPVDYRAVITRGFVVFCLTGTVAVGLLAGLLPAVVLSRIQPIAAMRGAHTTRPGGFGLRRALTGLQFTVSAALIALTIVRIPASRLPDDTGHRTEQRPGPRFPTFLSGQ